MALTNDELSDLRYYLGRGDNQAAIYVRGTSYQFEELDNALVRVTVDGEDRIRDMLAQLRDISTKITSALDCMDVEAVSDAKFRDPAHVLAILRREGRRLARALGAYLMVEVTYTPFDAGGSSVFATLRG